MNNDARCESVPAPAPRLDQKIRVDPESGDRRRIAHATLRIGRYMCVCVWSHWVLIRVGNQQTHAITYSRNNVRAGVREAVARVA